VSWRTTQYSYIHIELVEVDYWKLKMRPTNYVYNGSRTYLGPRPRMFRCCCMKPAVRHMKE